MLQEKNKKELYHRSQSFIISQELKEVNLSSKSIIEEISNREELKIKDLLTKIQILKQGVLSEREKNTEQQKEILKLKSVIEDYESEMHKKDDTINMILREKYELKSNLELEKLQNEAFIKNNLTDRESFSNLLTGMLTGSKTMNLETRKSSNQTSCSDDEEIDITSFKQLKNENNKILIENLNLKKRIEDQTKDFEKIKEEYQNLISLQLNKLKQIDSALQEKTKSNDEINKKLNQMYESFKKNEVEKTKYENKISELAKENKIREEKIVELINKLDQKENILNDYNFKFLRHQSESAALAMKLAELKNAILENNIVIQSYPCERICTFFNDKIELIFGRTNDNEYVMTIKENDSKTFVNIEDIEYFNSNENNPSIVDVCYLVFIYLF